jgi:hypothetical protein
MAALEGAGDTRVASLARAGAGVAALPPERLRLGALLAAAAAAADCPFLSGLAGTVVRLLTGGASRGETSGEADNDVSGLLTCTHRCIPSRRRRVIRRGSSQRAALSAGHLRARRLQRFPEEAPGLSWQYHQHQTRMCSSRSARETLGDTFSSGLEP